MLNASSVQARSLLGVLAARWSAARKLSGGLAEFVKPSSGSSLALLVTDLVDFTPLVETLGDVRARLVMRRHNAMLRKCVRELGGIEVTHTGDGIIACFHSAAAAVNCAIQIQAAVSRLNPMVSGPALHVRIGIHQGAALIEEGRLFGAAVVATVRICHQCLPDQILASRQVFAAVHELSSYFLCRGEHALKGFSEPFELFDVRWRPVAPTATLRNGSPLSGFSAHEPVPWLGAED